MPRHAVKLLATMGACSVFALALSSGAGAVEVNTHVNVPRINVPKPHITVPTVNNVPQVNLRHQRQSTGTSTLTNEKLNATTTVNTPFVGPSNGTGSAGAKIIIESVGGSGTPTQVQQQNAAAAAQAAVQAAMAADVPGATRIPGPSQSGLGQPQSGIIPPAIVAQPLQTKAAPIPCVEDCTLQESVIAAGESLKAACDWASSAASAYSDDPSLAVADAHEAIQTAENASDAAKNASFLAGRSGTPGAWAEAANAAMEAAEAWADAAAAMIAAGEPANSAAVANARQQAADMAALASEDASFAAQDQNSIEQAACAGGTNTSACNQAMIGTGAVDYATAAATLAAQVTQAISTWQATGSLSSDTACIYGG